MPQIPEQIRPIIATIAKYHFWILAALVPLLLVPMLFVGIGRLDTMIAGQRSQIESRVSALKTVQGIAEHPNEGWSQAVEAQTEKIREETLAEWQKFWETQQFLRAWPPRLGDDFLKAVAALKPGGALKRDLLLRYQNTVPEMVRELPKRMGADDLMIEGATPGVGGVDGGVGPRPFGAEGGLRPGMGGEFGGRPGMAGEFGSRPGAGPGMAVSDAIVVWSATDQKRIYDSFKWEKAPSTTQVLLAQEELWVYGLFCDTIKKLNAGAAGPFNAAVSSVVELAVGYPAAEDQPGGQGTGRVFRPAAAAGPGGGEFGGEGGMPSPEMAGGMGMGGELGGAAGRPLNPRFAGAAGPALGAGPMMGGEGGMDPAAAPVASPDEQLKEWIYVDFTGKPLTAAELGTVPAAKLVHLMPFVLRVTMDQRKLDTLLSDLATSPVPIDVRQVRINPSQQAGGAVGGPGRGEFGAPAMTMDGGGGQRPFDVTVELRGTVGLAPPPDKAAISGDQAAPGGNGA